MARRTICGVLVSVFVTVSAVLSSLIVLDPAQALVFLGPQQVSVGAPPVTGIAGGAIPVVPTTIPLSSAPSTPTTPTTPAAPTTPTTPTTPAAPTTKARKIVRRKTVAGTPTTLVATTVTVATTIVLDVSIPAPGPAGVGAGAALDPNSSAPVPVGETVPTTVTTSVVDAVVTSTSSPPIEPPIEQPSTSSLTTSSVPKVQLAPATPEELRKLFISALRNAGGKQSAAVSIGGQMIVDVNAGTPRLPASTQKIYVGAAALSVFGSDHRFQTTVRSSALASDSVAELTLVGGGDPSFSTADLRDLAQQVRAAGVATVSGRVNLDDTLFDRATTAPGWKAAFTPGEVGYLNALLVDGNHRNDAATVADAGLANLARFVAELGKAGVFVGPTVEQGRSPGGQQFATIATNRSAPLGDLVTYMLKKSENTYAEMLLKQLGTTSGQGSTQSGVAAVAAYFGRLGVAPPIVMVDGSGLSNQNRSTSSGQVTYLSKVSTSKVGESFRKALPIACLDGTLKSRMCGTSAAKNVVAKTGSLNYVATLTGYATTASGRPVVFSILVNDSPSVARSRLAMDKALAIVASYTG